MNNSESPASLDSKPSPWYERNLFWGPVAIVVGLVIAAISNHELRWLLWFAWPLTLLVVVWLAKRTREFWPIALMGSILSSAATTLLYLQLKTSPAPASATVQPVQPPAPSQTKPEQQPATQPKPKSQVSHRSKPEQTQPSVSQSGAGNNQTVIQPGVSIQQNANAPCSQNNIGSGNTNNCFINAPIERHLSDEQKAGLRNKSVLDACSPGKVEVWWAPTPEATNYGMEFIEALGTSVGRHSDWTLNQKQPIGIVLSRTTEAAPGGYVGTPNLCADAVRLWFIVAGIKFTAGTLEQRWTQPQPSYRPHTPPPTQEEMTPKKLPPETVIFIGTPEVAHSSK